MNIITQIHDEINALTWSQQIYNWDYVKNAPSPGCINDEEFASILKIASWKPTWEKHTNYIILTKWLYLHSMWKTLEYLQLSSKDLQLSRKDLHLSRNYYDDSLTNDQNKEKLLNLVKIWPNCHNFAISIILDCLPIDKSYCAALFNICEMNFIILKETILQIKTALQNQSNVPQRIKGIYYASLSEYYKKMKLSDFILICKEQIRGIKFTSSLRYVWITACIHT